METNEEMPQQHESGECCSSGSGGLKSLKTAIFIVVIIAACALAAHSVLTNGTGSPCGPSAAGLCPLNKSCAPSGACTLGASDTENATCIIKEKANNPSSGCPDTAVPGVCPKTAVPSTCPKTAVPGCCPNAGPN